MIVHYYPKSRAYSIEEVLTTINKDVMYKGNIYLISHIEVHAFYYAIFLADFSNGNEKYIRIHMRDTNKELTWPDGSVFGVFNEIEA